MVSYIKEENGLKVIGFEENEDNKDFLENIMFLEFKVKVGDKVDSGDELLSGESLKGTSELRSSVSGVVKEINEAVQEDPEILKERPTEWLLKIE